jgi:hypothetical protein
MLPDPFQLTTASGMKAPVTGSPGNDDRLAPAFEDRMGNRRP